MQRVSVRRIDEGTPIDYELLSRLKDEFISPLPEFICDALKNLDNSLASYQISRLEHSLQSATRAERDGADIEMVVGTLIHDLGDNLAPLNHSQLAAAIISPYVRSEVAWIIEDHGIFQLYYYGDAMGVDKNAREIHRGHKWFDSCENFCERWDQMSFDPDYTSYPLAHFTPMVREIFSWPPFDSGIVVDEL